MKKTLFILLSLLLMATAVSAANEVQLIKAETYTTSHYGYYTEHIELTVRVKNLSYDKKVVMWGELKDGGWEASKEGVYVGPAEAGYELWKINSNRGIMPYGGTPKYWKNPRNFVIKYEVGGQTYWDNNNGSNYSMGKADGEMLVGRNVLLAYGNAYYFDYGNKTVFYGHVLIQNLAYNKAVKIVYTTDNWNTTSIANCTFVSSHGYPYGTHLRYPNIHGVERWSFTVEKPGNGISKVEYVVAYEVNGQTYWDNNFGRNYFHNID